MTTEAPQGPENKPNIVRTTVRMDGDLHGFLTDFVYELGRGLPPRQRPTIDSVIQSAVRMYLEAGKTRPGLKDAEEEQLSLLTEIFRARPQGVHYDSLRKTIEVAINEFKKQKQRDAGKEAAGKSPDHHRRKTGTR